MSSAGYVVLLVPKELTVSLRAYSSNAIKLYLWLLLQDAPAGRIDLSRGRADEELGWAGHILFYNAIHELALGHEEFGDVIALPLIEILHWRRGRGARWIIKPLPERTEE